MMLPIKYFFPMIISGFAGVFAAQQLSKKPLIAYSADKIEIDDSVQVNYVE